MNLSCVFSFLKLAQPEISVRFFSGDIGVCASHSRCELWAPPKIRSFSFVFRVACFQVEALLCGTERWGDISSPRLCAFFVFSFVLVLWLEYVSFSKNCFSKNIYRKK